MMPVNSLFPPMGRFETGAPMLLTLEGTCNDLSLSGFYRSQDVPPFSGKPSGSMGKITGGDLARPEVLDFSESHCQ